MLSPSVDVYFRVLYTTLRDLSRKFPFLHYLLLDDVVKIVNERLKMLGYKELPLEEHVKLLTSISHKVQLVYVQDMSKGRTLIYVGTYWTGS